MYPKLLTISIPEFLQGFLPASFTLHSYGLMIALGVIVTFYVILNSVKDMRINSDQLSELFIWAIVSAFVGGKLFFFLEDIQRYLDDPSLIANAMSGGFVFYGSLIFTVPTIIFWLRKKKVSVRPFMDVLALGGPILHSFGRVGCFLAGCCHGKVCDSWIGVTFSHPDTLADFKDVPLYPTQLFDIGVNLFILLVVVLIRKRKQFEGQLFLIYLMLYAVGRSIVEIYRGDDARGFLFDGLLSHSQAIAIVVLVICGLFWRKWRIN
ncbi:MAG: prolipoprotein diacylglyceryl transferase [Bacteroidia bacterium]|nr:prolipoprotein diacylglyceryl transferase [Bacteroidia bacterium]